MGIFWGNIPNQIILDLDNIEGNPILSYNNIEGGFGSIIVTDPTLFIDYNISNINIKTAKLIN